MESTFNVNESNRNNIYISKFAHEVSIFDIFLIGT